MGLWLECLLCARRFQAERRVQRCGGVRAITEPHNLHAMIVAVSHYNIALPIQCNTAVAADLRWTTAVAAHAAHVSAVAHTKHLNTAVADPVMHKHVAAAINSNAAGILELRLSTASAANGSHVAAVAVAQYLHSMIVRVSYEDVACVVKRDAAGTVELSSA